MAEKKRSSGSSRTRREQTGLLASLPSTRPDRLGGRREGKRAKPAAAPRTKAAPTARAKPNATPRAKPAPPRTATTRRPAAVRAGAPQLEGRGRPNGARREPAAPPRGAELVTTAIQAAGELAQIGLEAGGRALKRAVDRLPRP